MDRFINTLIVGIRNYSTLTQTLALVGLGMLWVLLASFADYTRNNRFLRASLGGLAFVFGIAALLLTILMVLTIVMSASYGNLVFIGGVGIFLLVFATVVRYIVDDL